MIKLEDYFKTVDYHILPKDQQDNTLNLLLKVNALMKEFGEERIVTSGYRSMEDHKRIYKEINEKRKAKSLPELSVPMGSKHLVGAAIDLEDKDGKLDAFCTKEVLEKHDLYREHEDSTPNWCHLQCIKVASGNRIFKP